MPIYAQRYGALPISRATGGLRDTIVDPADDLDAATGFLYAPATGSPNGRPGGGVGLRVSVDGVEQPRPEEVGAERLQRSAILAPPRRDARRRRIRRSAAQRDDEGALARGAAGGDGATTGQGGVVQVRREDDVAIVVAEVGSTGELLAGQGYPASRRSVSTVTSGRQPRRTGSTEVPIPRLT